MVGTDGSESAQANSSGWPYPSLRAMSRIWALAHPMRRGRGYLRFGDGHPSPSPNRKSMIPTTRAIAQQVMTSVPREWRDGVVG